MGGRLHFDRQARDRLLAVREHGTHDHELTACGHRANEERPRLEPGPLFVRSVSASGQFVIVSAVLSHREEPVTRLSVEVKTTSHETVLLAVTETVELVVDRVTGDVAPLSV